MPHYVSALILLGGFAFTISTPPTFAQTKPGVLNRPLIELCDPVNVGFDDVLTSRDCEKLSGRTTFGDPREVAVVEFLSERFVREVTELGHADPEFADLARTFRLHLAHLGIPTNLSDQDLILYRRNRNHRLFTPVENLPMRTTHVAEMLRHRQIYFVFEALRWVRQMPAGATPRSLFDRDGYADLRTMLGAYLDVDLDSSGGDRSGRAARTEVFGPDCEELMTEAARDHAAEPVEL